MPYDQDNITLHFLAPVGGEITFLGSMAFIGAPERSKVVFCNTCGQVKFQVIAQNGDRSSPAFTSFCTTCADCGGDNTIIFEGYYAYLTSNLYKDTITPIPDRLLAYELDCAVTRQGSPVQFPPRYGVTP